MNKLNKLFITGISLFLMLVSINAQTVEAPSGSGTEADPYLIASASNYFWIAENPDSWTKKFKQTADFDIYGIAAATPIGNVTINFNGTYDGDGHALSGLRMTKGNESNIGMFGYTGTGAVIKNLDLISGNVYGYLNAGALVGNNNGSIINCRVSSYFYEPLLLSDHYVKGYSNNTGSFVGLNNGSITGCSSTLTAELGNQYGTGIVGGFVGYNTGIISNCYSTGRKKASASSVIDNSAGGFVGTNTGNISNCYSTGDVLDGSYAGGFVGRNENGTINNCYSKSDLQKVTFGGGFVGYNNNGTIDNCYSSGLVESNLVTTVLGGFAAISAGTITNCFWDTETSGQANSSGGTGKTTAEMKTSSTFTDAGWDFATPVWKTNAVLNNGYPFPEWQTFYNTQLSVSNITTTMNIIDNSNIGFTAQSGNISLVFEEMNSTPPNLPVNSVTIGKYWQISNITGGSIKLRLYYSSSLTSSFTGSPVIYHYNGSSWVALPTSAEIIDGNSRYVETTNYYASFSPVTVGDGSSALPVELISFTAEIKDFVVILEWQTATEVNNYGFEVERNNPPLNLLPGGEDKEWETIGFVPGHGNSNSPKSYSYFDNDYDKDYDNAGTIEYRLKQIDTDGSFEYFSTTTEVNIGITGIEEETFPKDFSLSQNYPNPFNPETTIRFGLPEQSSVRISIYNILGQEVMALLDETLSAGYHERLLNASFLASGLYIYTINSKSLTSSRKFSEVKKLMLVK